MLSMIAVAKMKRLRSMLDEYTKVLLHFDGTDASTVFIDETGRSWGAGGNAQLDTAQRVYGSGSLLLDGSGDYIETADSDDFYFGTGDLTIDFWFKPATVAYDRHCIFSQAVDSTHYFAIYVAYQALQLIVSDTSLLAFYYTGNVISSANTWYHIAITRHLGTVKFFINGIPVSATASTAISAATSFPNLAAMGRIGIRKYNAGTSDRPTNGQIDEFRISKGILRWDSYFAVGDAYSNVLDSYTKSLLHFDGIDASTVFTDQSGKIWTAHGNAQLSVNKYGYGSAVGNFDGSGDYISTPAHNDFEFGADDWTIDLWIYLKSYPSGSGKIISQYTDADNRWQLYQTTNTYLSFIVVSGGAITAFYYTNSEWLMPGLWYHLAICRSGSNFYLFKRGVLISMGVSTAIGSSTMPSLSSDICVGGISSGDNINAYIDELRISKGICRWTSGFKPGSPYLS